MGLVIADRVLETASSPGTGTVTLLGAVTGYQSFASAIGNGNTTYYTIADQSGSNWEVGIGTVTTGAPNTLSRTTVLSSSNGGSKTNFASGIQNVFVTYPAEKSVNLDLNGNATVNCLFEGFTSQAASGTQITLLASSVQNWVITGSGGQTIQLPDATTLPNGALFTFNNNQSSGTIVIKNNSGTTIATTQSGAFIQVTLLSNSIPAGSWDYHNVAPSNASWSTNTLSWAGTYSGGTWNGNTIGVLYGGTGLSSVTAGYIPYGNGTSALNTSANLTFNGTTLTVANDASISGLTVGKGGGSVSGNSAFGNGALNSNTSGANNFAGGYQALYSNTTASYNTAVGYQAGYANTTGQYNSFFGSLAGKANTANGNAFFGYATGISNTTGVGNSFFGALDGASGTGNPPGLSNTTGSYNTAIGAAALLSNTTANNNTAVGYQAGYSNTTGIQNTYIGQGAGYSNSTSAYNCFVGQNAGYNATGASNTLLGVSAGYYITSGAKNTVIGQYNGNQGGLDIRTASNYIVLSDGDGNPRGVFDGSGNFLVGTTSSTAPNSGMSVYVGGAGNAQAIIGHSTSSGSGQAYAAFLYNAGTIGSITQNGTTAVSYNTSSDYRLKENVQPMTGALDTVAKLKPVTYDWISDKSKGQGFIAHELQAVVPECVTGKKDAVDAEGKPVYQGVDTSFLVATLTAAIQELNAKVTALEAQLGAK